MTMRPSEIACRVAYALAVTVGSRVPGFVTQWPSFRRSVWTASSVRSGYASCQRMWESYVQPYSKPCSSASRISSTKRLCGGSGRTVTPKVSIRGGEILSPVGDRADDLHEIGLVHPVREAHPSP